MDCGVAKVSNIVKLKPLRVNLKRLRLKPENIRKWKLEKENDEEVIEIREEGLIKLQI